MSERGEDLSSERERTTVGDHLFYIWVFLLPLLLILSLRKLWGFLLYGFLMENSLCLLSLVFIDVHVILSDNILRSYCLNDKNLTNFKQRIFLASNIRCQLCVEYEKTRSPLNDEITTQLESRFSNVTSNQVKKLFIMSFQVSITLLWILQHLQILLYFSNGLFQVLQHFWSYHQTIHEDIHTNKGSTLPSIHDFKCPHLGRGF